MPPNSTSRNSTSGVKSVDDRLLKEIDNALAANVDNTKVDDQPVETIGPITEVEKPIDNYLYIREGDWSIVWSNVIFFAILHLIHFYGLYKLFAKDGLFKLVIFGWFYGFWGGLGVTAGAHRLWSHRSYKARLPLRIFLMLGHCVAGQNSLFIWCRDHRVHHKYSETDGDPHNSLRGFFFSHIGWLLRKKHPKVIAKGRSLGMEDLKADPVVMFQKRYYYLLYFLFAIFIPTTACVYLFKVSWFDSFVQATICRYVTSLHCTWFVNSAAHMFGSRPYSLVIKARENVFVSYGAFGEGYHNYHHTFPWDYSTSELNYALNITKYFIDAMYYIGQAYDLKRVPRSIIDKRLEKMAENNNN